MAIRLIAGTAPPVPVGPQLIREEWAAIAASAWVPIGMALEASKVRNVSILPRANAVGSAGNTWTGRLAVSRFADGNPITSPLAGAPTTQQIAARVLNNSADGMAIGKSWGWGTVEWTDANAELQPGDVLGVYWEKAGAPANLPAALIYVARLSPVRVT